MALHICNMQLSDSSRRPQILILSGGQCATQFPKLRRVSVHVSSSFSNSKRCMSYVRFSSNCIFKPSVVGFSSAVLRMSQPLPPVAPKAMMASSAFSVLNGSAQTGPALPSGIPKGPKASHHSHGKGAKGGHGGGAAATQGVNAAVHTHTAMGRWSILPKEPPSKLGLRC